jgi:hypothetical protein
MSYASRGSLWNRWDLHFHTPSSFDYHNKSVTDEQIVERLRDEGVRVVAITDHHVIDVDRIRKLQELGGDDLTVLPGMELRSDHGGKPINYICIFPEDCDLDHVWTTFQGKLGLTSEALRQKGGDDKVYVPIEDGAQAARELGGIVSIHAGGKSNSIEGISNREQFQQRIKYDITSKWVDLLEVGQLKDIDRYLNVVFPATGLDKPLIICSDNHQISEYLVKARLWLRADPTFRGLLMVLREPSDRVFIGDRPQSDVRVEQNRTKYIRSVLLKRTGFALTSEKWFSGKVEFNPGLVAIIGNKGSGKSALSDSLGLLGSTKNSDAFSFLTDNRFRHAKSSLASEFEATIEWESGESITRTLDEVVNPEEVERVKYLPQDHVENVCNEISGIGEEEGFERELKSVIFSHVPETQRLRHTNLDDLVQFQTDEKQNRIDSLLKQLRETARSRVRLEAQTDATVRLELKEKLKRRESELAALEAAKPVAVVNPAEDGDIPTDIALLQDLSAAEDRKNLIEVEITRSTSSLALSERRLAVANRLLERIGNFEKEFDDFKETIAEDATELGLLPNALATLSVETASTEKIRDAELANIASLSQHIDGDEPPGLSKQVVIAEVQIIEIQSRLDAPNRAYQAYLKALAEWSERRAAIEGTTLESESLEGLKVALSQLDQLPAEIEALKGEQLDIAVEIHEEKLAQASVYRTLYGPVQNFIDSHPLAKDRLRLEFRAELANEDFEARLLGLINQHRKGTFIGVDEGRTKAESLARSIDWEDAESVRGFLEAVDTSLHWDQREQPPLEVLLKNQLIKGKRPEEVFDLLYGLEYVRPRYILRWEGKDLSMLSPGERGTLLLVFYLLIDMSDLPLIIDQPEGNLDNHTVAKVLVDCVKEARKRRQVFIVTHNPNLAVVCDADQVIHASIDKADGNAVSYLSGALEDPAMSQYVTDVLEGTRWAFGVRNAKYTVGEDHA